MEEGETNKLSDSGQRPLNEAHAFAEFSAAMWTEWLPVFLDGRPCHPKVRYRDEELHRTLGRLYATLPGRYQRDQFAEAVLQVYRSTPHMQANAEALYCLLNLIALTLPPEGKALLIYHLRRKSLQGINYVNQDMHSVLLMACGEYEVDNDLASYIKNSANSIQDFQYLLTCFRALSTRGGHEAYDFMERLLPFVEAPAASAKLLRELHTVARNTGYQRFYEWYRSRGRILAGKLPVIWAKFEQVITERLLAASVFEARAAEDAYAAVLSAAFHAKINNLSPQMIATIAELHKTLGFDDAVDALVYIWEKAYDPSTGGFPWELVSSDEERGFIRDSGIQIGERIAYLNATDEPEIELVLLRVSEICEPQYKEQETVRAMATTATTVR